MANRTLVLGNDRVTESAHEAERLLRELVAQAGVAAARLELRPELRVTLRIDGEVADEAALRAIVRAAGDVGTLAIPISRAQPRQRALPLLSALAGVFTALYHGP